jgi:hypothetical protein
MDAQYFYGFPLQLWLMSSNVPSRSFNDTLGLISVGLDVSCVVFGVLTTQVLIYFRRYPTDRLVYQYLVRFCWC